MTRSAEQRLRKLEQVKSRLPRRAHSMITDPLGTAEERRPFGERRAELIASGVAAENDLFIETLVVDPDPEFERRERAKAKAMGGAALGIFGAWGRLRSSTCLLNTARAMSSPP